MDEEGGQIATRALNNPSNWVIHEEMTYASGTISRIETFCLVFVYLHHGHPTFCLANLSVRLLLALHLPFYSSRILSAT